MDMAKYTDNTKKNTDVHQQMPAQNLTPEVDRQGIQRYTPVNDQAQIEVDKKGSLQKPSPVKPPRGTPREEAKR